ncbi:hypothetical protein AGABI2DRAFT_221555 [Agaricus bisporus var. bisporus H97]|uniref:hypothetical protein n=1 Tax=Agaricus bisporus var. bisporus (strain H97 / ATCC MYA-4626 / FGSC 10389) TaxID=936046 RepID=UPI00029F5E30|nr:hypothetical protein AGABI2DRAFT_221555 [Agaricus bisporus var. bisporus H97]EKV47438.1 hypothetical protein AGABI2DRAFT_221555 [Agaricus bisporus var. bisporus H97]
MRKTSYVVTFILVSAILVLNVISTKRVDWLVVKSSEVFNTRITTEYGLSEICETIYTHVPSPGGDGEVVYRSHKCRDFPLSVQDGCDGKNRAFCAEWTSAGYIDQVAIGFGAVSLLAILFGVTTGSRRRRIWGVVSWLVLFHAICQLTAFAIITHNYDTAEAFNQARPGTGYILNIVSWVSGFLIALGVVATGLSAASGHKWAAGNRAYHTIPEGD